MSPFLGGAGNKIVIGAAMTLAEPESSQGAPGVCQHPSIITLETPEKPASPLPSPRSLTKCWSCQQMKVFTLGDITTPLSRV